MKYFLKFILIYITIGILGFILVGFISQDLLPIYFMVWVFSPLFYLYFKKANQSKHKHTLNKIGIIFASIIIGFVMLSYGVGKLGNVLNESRKNQAIIDESNRKIYEIKQKEEKERLATIAIEREKIKPLMNELKDKVVKEKKVIAATWSRNLTDQRKDVLYVAVPGDGTSRNGFAEYLCLIANEVGLSSKGIEIIITDAIKSINGGDFTPIGMATCK
ncbi:hypothetical protein PF327_11220 [Sulfurovum sp. XTW-4]|uniref:Uncharacterized protein n=1 Tax=Sulfurovum xiamenensis TaxID=3019066 RepID=A0ABT7QUK4_9BACT|nr:hypothetical protein [Sulfurovum xiamenensis]MDM5264765.1 hypothetical protein [Sulfurovum xiamenensis]